MPKTPSRFMFESLDDEYRHWEMIINDRALPPQFSIYPILRDGKKGPDRYKGGISDGMELYDIMVDVGILPEED
jgi:hypothetical protein